MTSPTADPITDSELDTVRALAALGRPIPAIVMAAIVKRLEDAQPPEEREPALQD